MISVRHAISKDAESIAKLNANEFGYKYPVEKTKERIKDILNKSTDRIFVVCENNAVVGYAYACNYEGTYFDAQKNIMAIAIDSNHRGKGLGKALLNAVEDWAKVECCIGIRLVSGIDRTGAHEFYRHCGYKLRKEQKNFIKIF